MPLNGGEVIMRWRGRYCLLLLLLATSRVGAQTPDAASLMEPPRFYVDYMTLIRTEMSVLDAASPTPTRTARLQMFRMPSGFFSMPLSLVPEDDPLPDDPVAKADDDFGFVQIAYGNHVPYLDIPTRGDLGGFGYYKVHSQVQIFDLGPTNVSLAVRALAPMGLQSGGVNGPTFLSPALACFHDLGDGAAIHAFVGQELAANARWRDQLQTSLRCGLAVQHPLPFTSYNADQGLFVFVQALGQYRPDSSRTDVRSTTWDVIPGLQYRVNNACWMSMGISRYQFMSCVWQY
jgi:hypothetical protein